MTWAVNPSSKAAQGVPCATPGSHRRNQSFELYQEASAQPQSSWVIVQYGLGRLWVGFTQTTLCMKMENRKKPVSEEEDGGEGGHATTKSP